MTYEEAEKYVHSLSRFSSYPGLDRMRCLLEKLGNPQKKLKFIHVAGTNGKGSVTTLCANILQRAGYRTGLYISPYVTEFRERFQINGQMIGQKDFARLLEKIIPYAEEMKMQGDGINEFECNTALAFLYFAEQKCDVVCLEVGLGGRCDSTNIIDTALVSVITAISLDHTKVLGDTVAQIAHEKAGIIKATTSVVTYPKQDDDALVVIMEECAKKNSSLIMPNIGGLHITNADIFGSDFCYGNQCYHIGLVGKHQVYNCLMVLEVMQILTQMGYVIPREAMLDGISQTKFPARFEVISSKPLIVIDGAHNYSGMKALAQTIKELRCFPKVAVIGMLADKDYTEAVKLISPLCKQICTVPIDNPRSLSPQQLKNSIQPYCQEVTAYSSREEALQMALEKLEEEDTMLICGSLYLAGEMRLAVLQK